MNDRMTDLATAHDIDLAALGGYDTPTICNALLQVAPEAARHSTKAMLHCARPGLPPMVGFARTALYRTMEPGEASTRRARGRRTSPGSTTWRPAPGPASSWCRTPTPRTPPPTRSSAR